MAILFAGHELDCFEYYDTINIGHYIAPGETTPRYDMDYSRCSLYCSAAATRSAGAKATLPTPLAEGWVQMRTYRGSNVNQNVVLSAFSADDASTLFDLWFTSSGNAFGIRGATSDTARTAISPTTPFTTSTMAVFTVHWKAVSGGMLLELFRDGGLVATATVSNSYLNGKTVGILRFGGDALGTASSSGSNYGWNHSEIVVSDVDPRGWRVATIAPNAAGTASEWSGSYADVDEVDPNDADFISTDTAERSQLMGMSNLSIAAQNMDVVGVELVGRARKGTLGPQNIQALLRTNGVVYPTANLPDLLNEFSPLKRTIWDANPNTGVAFTVSEIQALEMGFKSKA